MKHFARPIGPWMDWAEASCGAVSTRRANDALDRLTRNPDDVECLRCCQTIEFATAVEEMDARAAARAAS